jgi:hypothetical protein
MRLSKEKKQELFDAISDPIQDKRVMALKTPLTEGDLYLLDLIIWERVKKVLKMESEGAE